MCINQPTDFMIINYDTVLYSIVSSAVVRYLLAPVRVAHLGARGEHHALGGGVLRRAVEVHREPSCVACAEMGKKINDW